MTDAAPAAPKKTLKIDFVSDVVCPWCVVGLGGLETALDRLKAEETWRARGISSVPAVVVEGKYLISGGQPPEAFEQALRQIASEG